MVKKRLRKELSEFQKEFRKHLTTFITGAFAFVSALLWRDAIQSLLDIYKKEIEYLMPFHNIWLAKFFIAFAVSVIAVVAIVIISKVLKIEKK
jgi:hypothetical protein